MKIDGYSVFLWFMCLAVFSIIVLLFYGSYSVGIHRTEMETLEIETGLQLKWEVLTSPTTATLDTRAPLYRTRVGEGWLVLRSNSCSSPVYVPDHTGTWGMKRLGKGK